MARAAVRKRRMNEWGYEIGLALMPFLIRSVSLPVGEKFDWPIAMGSFDAFLFSLVLIGTTQADLIGDAPNSGRGIPMRGIATYMIIGAFTLVIIMSRVAEYPGTTNFTSIGIIAAILSFGVTTRVRSTYLWG